jgi:hypothetical protein
MAAADFDAGDIGNNGFTSWCGPHML